MPVRPIDRHIFHQTHHLSSGYRSNPPAAVLAGSTCPAAAVRIQVVHTAPVVGHTALAVVHKVPDLERTDSVMRRSSRWEERVKHHSRVLGAGIGLVLGRHRGVLEVEIEDMQVARRREGPKFVSFV